MWGSKNNSKAPQLTPSQYEEQINNLKDEVRKLQEEKTKLLEVITNLSSNPITLSVYNNIAINPFNNPPTAVCDTISYNNNNHNIHYNHNTTQSSFTSSLPSPSSSATQSLTSSTSSNQQHITNSSSNTFNQINNNEIEQSYQQPTPTPHNVSSSVTSPSSLVEKSTSTTNQSIPQLPQPKPKIPLNLIIVKGQKGLEQRAYTNIKSFLQSSLLTDTIGEEYQLNVYNVNNGDTPPKEIYGVCLYVVNLSTARLMLDEHAPDINDIKKHYPNCKVVLGIWLFGVNSEIVSIHTENITDGMVTFIYSGNNNIVVDKCNHALQTINQLLVNNPDSSTDKK